MPKIKCEVDQCAYNSHSTCIKNHIDVDGMDSRSKKDTACSSYKLKDFDAYSFEFANIDPNTQHTEVYCDVVRCVFERGQRCHADRIVIKNISNSNNFDNQNAKNSSITHCQTFESKD